VTRTCRRNVSASNRTDWRALYFEERRILHELVARLGVALPSAPKAAAPVTVVPPVPFAGAVTDDSMQRLAATIAAARPELSAEDARRAAQDALERFATGGE